MSIDDRTRQALRRFWRKAETESWIYGKLGRLNTDGTYTFTVPGRSTFVYVTLREASGAQTVVPARNDAGVRHAAKLNVRMKLEHGVYVIFGETGDQSFGNNPAAPPTGVRDHNHDELYYRETEHKSTSAGVADAGKPVVLNPDGLIDPTMLSGTVPESTDDLPEGSTNLYYTAERTQDMLNSFIVAGAGMTITYDDLGNTLTFVSTGGYTDELIQDLVGAMTTGNTESGITVTYQDADGTIDFELDATLVSIAALGTAANKMLYTTGIDTWAEADITAAGRNLLDDADASAMRTTLGLGTIATEAETNYVLVAGTRPLTGNWDIGNSFRILADGVRARDSDGFVIEDDAGNAGFWLADGGRRAVLGASSYTDPYATYAAQDQYSLFIRQPTATAATSPSASVYLSNNQTDTTSGNIGAITWMNEAIAAATKLVGQLLVQTDADTDQGKMLLRTFDSGVSIDVLTLLASGAATFADDLTVSGDLVVTLTSKFDDTVIFSDGTVDYHLTSMATGVLELQAQTSAQPSSLRLFAKDGDATDDVIFDLWGLGLPASTTNRERLTMRWDSANSFYGIRMDASGTGTLRQLRLYTGTDTDQLVLETDGKIGIQVAAPTDALDLGGALRLTANVAFDAAKPGRIYKGSTGGLTLVGVTGSSNDMVFASASGGGLFANPTGTNDAVFNPTVGSAGFGTSTSTLLAQVHVREGTLNNEVVRFETTATNDDPCIVLQQQRAATTNATVTTLQTIAIPASNTVSIHAIVTCRRTGGSAGTAEDGGRWELKATYKNVAGTATLIGALTSLADSDNTYTATLDTSTSNVRVRVTGATNNNVTWHVSTWITYVGS